MLARETREMTRNQDNAFALFSVFSGQYSLEVC